MVESLRLSCRACGSPLDEEFVDLGLSPISNAFPRMADRRGGEMVYPLRTLVCSACRLVQLEDFGSRETHFNDDYAYFSSVSSSWLEHAAGYADMAIARFSLGSHSRVVEIASNDGYLLKNFIERGIPCLGVDPAANCAATARERFSVDTHIGFFGAAVGTELVERGWKADLMIANNVLAHVPDIRDFVAGFKTLLATEGTATFEFPHLLQLVRQVQYDTIYHEHYSYLSIFAVELALSQQGLRVYDLQHLPTHGGSLRLYVCHRAASHSETPELQAGRQEEREAGVQNAAFYAEFASIVRERKRELLRVLIDLKQNGARICGYGAAAKGTTLLNYCGIGTDMIDFVVDRSPHKQNRLVPGTGIPIYAPDRIERERPDYVLILPWNISDEIIASMAHIRGWGGKFIVPMPFARIID